jgi:hypothetical protein
MGVRKCEAVVAQLHYERNTMFDIQGTKSPPEPMPMFFTTFNPTLDIYGTDKNVNLTLSSRILLEFLTASNPCGKHK